MASTAARSSRAGAEKNEMLAARWGSAASGVPAGPGSKASLPLAPARVAASVRARISSAVPEAGSSIFAPAEGAGSSGKTRSVVVTGLAALPGLSGLSAEAVGAIASAAPAPAPAFLRARLRASAMRPMVSGSRGAGRAPP